MQSFGHLQLDSLVLTQNIRDFFAIFFLTCTKIDNIDKNAIFIYHLKALFMCFQMMLEL